MNIEELLFPAVMGAGGFAPTDFATILFWINGADATTLFEDTGRTDPVDVSGDFVAGVADSSSGSNHLLQATAAHQPTYIDPAENGLSAIRCDGTNDHLEWASNALGNAVDGAAGFTAFFCLANWTVNGPNNNDNILVLTPINNNDAGILINIRGDGGDASKVRAGGRSQGGDSFQQATSTEALGDPGIFAVKYDYGADAISFHGDISGSASVSFSSGTYSLGTPTRDDILSGDDGTNEFQGDFCEVFAYGGCVE